MPSEDQKLKSYRATRKNLIRWRGSASHPEVRAMDLAIERRKLDLQRERVRSLAASIGGTS